MLDLARHASRPCKPCPGVLVLPAFPYLFPVPRYGTFRSEKFFSILGGENAKMEWIKNLTQMYQISSFQDSRSAQADGGSASDVARSC